MGDRLSTVDAAACRAHLRRRQEQRFQAREHRRPAVLQASRAAGRAIMPHLAGVRRAYLFGSVLHPGAMRPDSDVDIAVEGELSAEEYFALWRALEQAADWPVQLVELDAGLHFAAYVRENGELVYEHGGPDPESAG